MFLFPLQFTLFLSLHSRLTPVFLFFPLYLFIFPPFHHVRAVD